jgi:integrase
MAKITKRTVDSLSARANEYFVWDDELSCFGVRVMPSGKASYVVQYRAGGRTRRNAFSAVGAMTPDEARKHARELLVAVDKGGDPVAEIEAQRRMPNVAALCDQFLTDHVANRCKPITEREYRRCVVLFIKPHLGTFKVGDVKRQDIAKLHHALSHTRYQANRTLAVLSKLFNLAEVWGLRPDGSNPCRHVKKYPERKRERYLTPEEMLSLGTVLADAERDGSEPAPVIAAVRLLMLTGARLAEIQTLKWEYVRKGCIVLPDSKTGPKRIELGTVAEQVLARIKRVRGNPYVITGTVEGQHWNDLQRPWRRIREKAQLPGLRIHDLRHSYASLAASDGESLSIIGKLLGHTQAQTTARYAHLAPASVRATAERIADAIAQAMNLNPAMPQAANDNDGQPRVAAE